MSVRPNSSCPPRPKRHPPMLFQQVLLQVKLERTVNLITSVKLNSPVRPARSEMLAPPEARCTPRPKRVARPARSEKHAPLEANYSPHSKRDTRPARSELHAPPEARYTLRSEGASPYAHREIFPPPVGRYSLRSEGAFPYTRRDVLASAKEVCSFR